MGGSYRPDNPFVKTEDPTYSPNNPFAPKTTPEYSADNPFAPHGTVTPGPLMGVVGPHGESLITSGSMAEIAAGEHGLAPMIGAAERAGRGRPGYQNIGNIGAGEKTDLPVVTADQLEAPSARAALARDVAKRTAPGVGSTATSIALSNLMAPISERMAEGGTEHALTAYAEGGGDPSAHAGLFGTAAAFGAVAGNVTVGKALAPAAGAGARSIPLLVTRGGRLGQAVVSGAISQGLLGAGGEALTGDETGQRNISDIAAAGARQAVVGAAFGGILGGVGEVVGTIAERSAARQLARAAAAEARPSPSLTAPPSSDIGSVSPIREATTPLAIYDRRTAPSENRVAWTPEDRSRYITDKQKAFAARVNKPWSQWSADEKTAYFAEQEGIKAGFRNGDNQPVPPTDVRAPNRKPVSNAVNSKFRLVSDDALVNRAAELSARVQDYSEGGHGAPAFVRDAVDLSKPIYGSTRVAGRLNQDQSLYQDVVDELGARGWEHDDIAAAVDERAGMQYRNAGLGLTPGQKAKVGAKVKAARTGYRTALVNPYAPIEKTHPELNGALLESGAAPANASYVADRAVGWVLRGLSSEQEKAFGNQLVLDNLRAEASRKSESDPVAAARFTEHANALEQEMAKTSGDVSGEPWFQAAVARHKQYVENPLTDAAVGSGVAQESLRAPTSGYVKLVSEDRLTNSEIRRAMDANAVEDPSQLKPRSAVGRFFLGERPGLTRLFSPGAHSLREGPLNPEVPSTRTNLPSFRRGATRTGSARMAQGTAREYVTDYRRIVAQDAMNKLPRAADNAVYAAVAKSGRELSPGEEPAIGKKAVERTVLDGNGHPKVQRFEVEPKVAAAIGRYEQQRAMTDETGWRKFTSLATRAQIAGMPVEATSHMNTIASIVGSVPGEKDMVGRAMAAVPVFGGKAAAVREMVSLNLDSPASRTLESRLARIGALRVQAEHGGLINTSTNKLFGPTGVDVRGRLVLARKFLDRKPNASDTELREFITSKLGNYIRPNSGTATNALQSAGISAFGRFQAARIPTSVRLTFGQSDLPTSSITEKVADVANTLYRGPIGYALGVEGLNRALTGHGTNDNERGHQYDVQLPFTVGPHERPVYLPVATLNPVLATGMRAAGLRALIPRPGSPNVGGRIADAATDVVNTGLGILSPAVRAASVAATGRTPYVRSDGSMLKVVDNKFGQMGSRVNQMKAAIMAANPAVSAFAGQGGDVGGSTLAGALSEDGKFLGGPKAIGARLAAFTLPRIATVGVGGRDNAMSADARDEREYIAAMTDYKAALRRAAGPKDQDKIIEAAMNDAARDGRFDPRVVERELDKYLQTPQDKRDLKNERATQAFTRKHD